MRNIFAVINLALILIVIALATISVRAWMAPKYPDRIDAAAIAPAPKTLEPLNLKRKFSSSGIIAAVVQGNLFSKSRKAFRATTAPRRTVPVAQVANNSPLPPPNLELKGVLLLGTRKIAIMEGNYPVREANQAIKQKPLKKKGYALGSQIGSFELTQIEKTNVTLDNKRGVIINLNLSKRPSDKVIKKVGNNLVQKDKNFDPRKIKKVSPPRRQRRQRNTIKPVSNKANPTRPQPRAYRISGAPTQIPAGAPRPRISGR